MEHASKPFMKHKAMAFSKVNLICYRLDNEHVSSHYEPLHVQRSPFLHSGIGSKSYKLDLLRRKNKNLPLLMLGENSDNLLCVVVHQCGKEWINYSDKQHHCRQSRGNEDGIFSNSPRADHSKVYYDNKH